MRGLGRVDYNGPTVTSPTRTLAAVLALLLAAGVARGADELVLGMSAAFTGPSKGLGIELYRGAAAYFAAVNEAGGIGGRRVVIRTYDDGYDPGPAIENTVRLIQQDEALLLFSYVGTPTVTRVLPLLRHYADRSIFLFFPFSGAQPQREPPYDRFVLNLRASYRQESAALVDQFVRLGRGRIAVFYQADAYGRSGWDGVRRRLAAYGRTEVAEATYRRGTPFNASFRQQVEIIRAGDPEAVVAIGAYGPCAAFVRDMRDANLEVPIANVSFVGSESLLDLLSSVGATAGKDYSRRLVNTQVVPSYEDTALPAVREYRTLTERYDPRPPAPADRDYRPLKYSYVGFEGFLDAKLLAEILRHVRGRLDRRAIGELLQQPQRYDIGIAEPVTFGPDRRQALDHVYFTHVVDGRFVPLEDWREFAP